MKSVVLKQTVMNRVLLALAPMALAGIFLFGWRVLAVLLVSNLAAFFTEWLFVRRKKPGKVSMAVFVTGSLLGLSLPPTVPLWIAAVGAVVAIAFGKMVFGGFGANMFNPAIVGRTFIYVSFPEAMQIVWLRPFTSLPGGFACWMRPEAVTSATLLRDFVKPGISDIPAEFSLRNAALGFVPGCIGETSAVLIALAAVYLVITKTAKWQPMLSTLAGFALFSALFEPVNPLLALASGGIMFGAVFMVTDPVSMPKNKQAVWISGLLVGFLTVFIRRFSLFPEGFMFALLLSNTLMPIVEYGLEHLKKKRGKA